MARSKQPVPIRRETSSEYTGKHERAPNGTEMVGKGKIANGDAGIVARRDTSSKDSGAGAIQLLICVAGIYGSL